MGKIPLYPSCGVVCRPTPPIALMARSLFKYLQYIALFRWSWAEAEAGASYRYDSREQRQSASWPRPCQMFIKTHLNSQIALRARAPPSAESHA